MIKRAVFGLILFTTVFLGPWWLATSLGLFFIILFKNYWEAFIAAIFMDALYSVPSDHIWGSFGAFTLLFLFIIIIAAKVKKQIRI